MSIDPMPIVTLKSGLRVGNLNACHSMTFEDGSVLPACTDHRSVYGSLLFDTTFTTRTTPANVQWRETRVQPHLSKDLSELVQQAFSMWERGEVDVVIVSRSVLDALKSDADEIRRWTDPEFHPFRTGRLSNRIEDVCFEDLFCF